MHKRGYMAQVARLDQAEKAREVTEKKLEQQANELAELQKQVGRLTADRAMAHGFLEKVVFTDSDEGMPTT